MRLLTFTFLLCTCLFARENPFAPSTLQGSGVGQLQPQTTIPMEAQRVQLPVDAVKINTITINYQMIDGKIETRVFTVNKSIAPDKPIIFEQK